MYSLSPPWQNFFVAELGALATLTGLVVVAISINLSRILSLAHLPKRAGEALLMLVGALVVASIAIVPDQPAVGLGGELVMIGCIMFVAPISYQWRAWTSMQGVTTTRKLARFAITSLSSLPFIAAGLLIASGAEGGLYWAAAGMIVSLVAGVGNAWILLVEILR